MSKAIILHTFLRLARPNSLVMLVSFVFLYPLAIIAFMNRMPEASFDFKALLNLFMGPLMINLIAFAFISGSIGNTKSLDDGEYLALLFSRPLFRWNYVVSKWLAGSAVIIIIIGLQILFFAMLLPSIGRGNALCLGFIDLGNFILNTVQAAALIIMVFSFPSRTGAVFLLGLIYCFCAVPFILNAIPASDLWLNADLRNIMNIAGDFLRGFIYSPFDLHCFFDPRHIIWSSLLAFISNIALYIWLAIIVMNKREFFYAD